MSEQNMGARHAQDMDPDGPTAQGQFEPIEYTDEPYADDQYVDEGYAEEPYVAAPAPVTKPRKNPWLPLLIGGGALIVAIAVVLGVIYGYVLPRRALNASMASFDQAAQAYTDAQTELSTQLAAAQAVTAVVTAEDLEDPTTLDTLATQITAAEALVAPAPAPAATAAEIDQQTADLVAKTKPATDAAAALVDAVNAVQQSRISLAVTALTAATQTAQTAYDNSSWIDDDTVRADLMAQLNAAFLAIADPTSLGDNPDAILAALAQLQVTLADAVDAVNASEDAATKASYNYLLLADSGQAICGVNLCSGGTTLVSVNVTVKSSTVTADITFAADTGNRSTVTYKGTRKGTTAIITPQSGGNAFQWGIITFSGTDPNSPAVRFDSADNCKRQNGSTGTPDIFGVCR